MNGKIKIIVVLIMTYVLCALPAFSKPNVTLLLEKKKLVIEKGKENIVDASIVSPGDILIFTIRAENKGDSAALQLEPTGDIPSNTLYIPEKNTSKDYKTFFSIDNGKTFQEKPLIKIKQKGKEISKDAPLDMYGKIMWKFSTRLESGKSVVLSYKVKVK